jgi:hypothetical protein
MKTRASQGILYLSVLTCLFVYRFQAVKMQLVLPDEIIIPVIIGVLICALSIVANFMLGRCREWKADDPLQLVSADAYRYVTPNSPILTIVPTVIHDIYLWECRVIRRQGECKFMFVENGVPIFGLFKLRDIHAYRTNGVNLELFMKQGIYSHYDSFTAAGIPKTQEIVDYLLRDCNRYTGQQPLRVANGQQFAFAGGTWRFW